MEPAVGTGGRGRRSGRNRRRRSWWNRLFLSAGLRAGGSKKKTAFRRGSRAEQRSRAFRRGSRAFRRGSRAFRRGSTRPTSLQGSGRRRLDGNRYDLRGAARSSAEQRGVETGMDDAEQRRLGWARNSAE